MALLLGRAASPSSGRKVRAPFGGRSAAGCLIKPFNDCGHRQTSFGPPAAQSSDYAGPVNGGSTETDENAGRASITCYRRQGRGSVANTRGRPWNPSIKERPECSPLRIVAGRIAQTGWFASPTPVEGCGGGLAHEGAPEIVTA